MRLGPAGHRQRRAGHCPGRLRRGHRRRQRIHEPGPLLRPGRPLRCARGRCQKHRLHAGHPARPLAKNAHGHHRRKRGRALWHQPPDAGRTGRAQPATRRRRHGRRVLQRANHPVEIATRKGVVLFQEDEHVRASTTLETLAGMKPAFKKDGGTVTAGNASGINDGASAVVLAAGERVAAPGPQTPGPPGGLRPCRGGARLHGHRPRARHAQSAGAHRPEAGRHRRDRGQRSLRRPGLRGGAGAGF